MKKVKQITAQVKYLKDNAELIAKVLVESDDPEYIGLYATKETLRIIVDTLKDTVTEIEYSLGQLINERAK